MHVSFIRSLDTDTEDVSASPEVAQQTPQKVVQFVARHWEGGKKPLGGVGKNGHGCWATEDSSWHLHETELLSQDQIIWARLWPVDFKGHVIVYPLFIKKERKKYTSDLYQRDLERKQLIKKTKTRMSPFPTIRTTSRVEIVIMFMNVRKLPHLKIPKHGASNPLFLFI